jgi:uncharacterized delta-60 repeat protein
MATAVLSIHTSDPTSPKEIPCSSQIGNEEQECDVGYVGDPVLENTVFRDTLAAANTAANLLLDCELDVFPAQASGTNLWVFALAEQADGKILVGGSFTTLCGDAQPRLGRINRNGTRDTSFNPVVNGTVDFIRILANGKILIVGSFTQVNGETDRVRVAILNADGTLDSFVASLSSSPSNSTGDVCQLAGGDILIAGNSTTTTVNGVAWGQRFVRLTLTGTHVTAFNPSTSGGTGVFALCSLPNGNIVCGGGFTDLAGNAAMDRIGLIDDSGAAVAGWTCSVTLTTDAVSGLKLLSDGSVLAVGNFDAINATACKGVARLNSATGALVPGWTDPLLEGGSPAARFVSEQTDGKLVVSGDITSVGGVTWGFIARLNADGSRDTSWPDPGTRNGDLWITIVLSDGPILVGFVTGTTIYAATRDGLALISPDGTLVPLA